MAASSRAPRPDSPEPPSGATGRASPFEVYRQVADERRRIWLLSVLALVGAQIEALALVLVVPLAQTLAQGQERFTGELGPLQLDVPRGVLVGVTIGLLVAALAMTAIEVWLKADTVARWQRRARRAFIAAWFDADWPTQSATRSGFLAGITGFVGRGGIALVKLIDLAGTIATLVVFGLTALFVSALASVMILVIGGGFFIAFRPFAQVARRASARIGALAITYNEELVEAGGAAREVRLFDRRDRFVGHLGAIIDDVESAQARQTFLSGLTQPLYQFGGMTMAVVAVVAAAALGEVDIAGLGAVALLLVRSVSYGQSAQLTYQQLAESGPYLEMLRDAQDSLTSAAVRFGSTRPDRIERLDLMGVSYRYPGDHRALEAVDLHLEPGRLVGIAGVSGSGKSTLAQILLRLRLPAEGQYLVSGLPAPEIEQAWWARRVVLVPQDVLLVHGSLADNVRFFDDEIGPAEVERALTEAGLDTLVAALPDGVDSIVGPTTRNVSGGQLQRIGLARALARDPQVLVLDEPTSALDPHAEAVVHRALARLSADRIVVVIAHRRSTLERCDRVVLLDEGRVVADGPTDAVLARTAYFTVADEPGPVVARSQDPAASPDDPVADPADDGGEVAGEADESRYRAGRFNV